MSISRTEIQIEADLRAILLPRLVETNQDSLVKEINNNSSFLIASYLNDARYDSVFKDFYNTLIEEEKIFFLDKMLKLCLKEKNTNLLLLFKNIETENNSPLFENRLNKLSNSSKLQLGKLLAIEKIESDILKAAIQEFTSFGSLTKEGALLSLAQTENRKKIEFLHQPTVLDLNDFKEYLEILKLNSSKPLRKDFIFAAEHWLTGTVQIDKDENVSILLVDSLGENLDSNKVYFEQLNKVFPKANIYHNFLNRQGTPLSCGIFALEDLRKLNKIDQYLEKNIFLYLSEQKNSHKEILLNSGKISINLCQLPLALERIMQSKKLYDTVIPGRSETERKSAINKKGLTAEKSIKLDFIEIETKKGDQIEKKPQNVRIYKVLEKLFNYNLDFVLNNEEDFILKKMNKFSLKGFRKSFLSNNKKGVSNLVMNSIHKPFSLKDQRNNDSSLEDQRNNNPSPAAGKNHNS
ncbi:MAG: hypothetical protein JO131_06110 [Gammaproteobacteria bacterium]|nr:hypothetical protein [Gammaproteobacteria bacterium]